MMRCFVNYRDETLLLAIAYHRFDEAPECLRVIQYVEGRVRCVFKDRFHEKRAALASVPQQPEPEIGTFARSPDCSPSASED
jgi:hypothetical protein